MAVHRIKLDPIQPERALPMEKTAKGDNHAAIMLVELAHRLSNQIREFLNTRERFWGCLRARRCGTARGSPVSRYSCES